MYLHLCVKKKKLEIYYVRGLYISGKNNSSCQLRGAGNKAIVNSKGHGSLIIVINMVYCGFL